MPNYNARDKGLSFASGFISGLAPQFIKYREADQRQQALLKNTRIKTQGELARQKAKNAVDRELARLKRDHDIAMKQKDYELAKKLETEKAKLKKGVAEIEDDFKRWKTTQDNKTKLDVERIKSGLSPSAMNFNFGGYNTPKAAADALRRISRNLSGTRIKPSALDYEGGGISGNYQDVTREMNALEAIAKKIESGSALTPQEETFALKYLTVPGESSPISLSSQPTNQPISRTQSAPRINLKSIFGN